MIKSSMEFEVSHTWWELGLRYLRLLEYIDQNIWNSVWGTKDNAVMEKWWTQNSLEDPKDLMMAFCLSFHPLQF